MTESELERQSLCQSGMTVVANIKTDLGLVAWAESCGKAVYVGRTMLLAKPKREGSSWVAAYPKAAYSRILAVRQHEQWLRSQPGLMARLPELRGKVLLCWCHPEPCHADTLARLADDFEDFREKIELGWI